MGFDMLVLMLIARLGELLNRAPDPVEHEEENGKYGGLYFQPPKKQEKPRLYVVK